MYKKEKTQKEKKKKKKKKEKEKEKKRKNNQKKKTKKRKYKKGDESEGGLDKRGKIATHTLCTYDRPFPLSPFPCPYTGSIHYFSLKKERKGRGRGKGEGGGNVLVAPKREKGGRVKGVGEYHERQQESEKKKRKKKLEERGKLSQKEVQEVGGASEEVKQGGELVVEEGEGNGKGGRKSEKGRGYQQRRGHQKLQFVQWK